MFLENPRIFLEHPRIFLENPRIFLENPRIFLEHRRIFLENPRIFVASGRRIRTRTCQHEAQRLPGFLPGFAGLPTNIEVGFSRKA